MKKIGVFILFVLWVSAYAASFSFESSNLNQLKTNLKSDSDFLKTNNLDILQKNQIMQKMEVAANLRIKKLEEIAETNPSEAILQAFTEKELSIFPKQINDKFMEKRVNNEKTELTTIFVDDFNNERIEYYAQLNSKLVKLISQNNQELNHFSGKKIKISGIEFGNNFVLTAPISSYGQSKSVSESSVSNENLGIQNVAVIVFNFNDTNRVYDKPLLQAQAKSVMDFYNENSYNKTFLNFSFFGTYTIPMQTRCADYISIMKYAISVADAEIYYPNFQRLILYFSDNSCHYGGLGTIGKTTIFSLDGTSSASISWLPYGMTLSYGAHELGHNFGAYHANNYYCGANVNSGSVNIPASCISYEYGDPFEIMDAGAYSNHFSAYYKEKIGWFSPENTIKSSEGTYFLEPIEKYTNGLQVVKVPYGLTNYYYYLEYRQPLGFDSKSYASLNGVLIRFSNRYSKGGYSHLIDVNYSTSLSSYSRSMFYDALLKNGMTYVDSLNNLSFTMLNSSANGAYVKISNLSSTFINSTPTPTPTPSPTPTPTPTPIPDCRILGCPIGYYCKFIASGYVCVLNPTPTPTPSPTPTPTPTPTPSPTPNPSISAKITLSSELLTFNTSKGTYTSYIYACINSVFPLVSDPPQTLLIYVKDICRETDGIAGCDAMGKYSGVEVISLLNSTIVSPQQPRKCISLRIKTNYWSRQVFLNPYRIIGIAGLVSYNVEAWTDKMIAQKTGYVNLVK